MSRSPRQFHSFTAGWFRTPYDRQGFAGSAVEAWMSLDRYARTGIRDDMEDRASAQFSASVDASNLRPAAKRYLRRFFNDAEEGLHLLEPVECSFVPGVSSKTLADMKAWLAKETGKPINGDKIAFLTEEQEKILALRARGKTAKEIGIAIGVPTSQASNRVKEAEIRVSTYSNIVRQSETWVSGIENPILARWAFKRFDSKDKMREYVLSKKGKYTMKKHTREALMAWLGVDESQMELTDSVKKAISLLERHGYEVKRRPCPTPSG